MLSRETQPPARVLHLLIACRLLIAGTCRNKAVFDKELASYSPSSVRQLFIPRSRNPIPATLLALLP